MPIESEPSPIPQAPAERAADDGAAALLLDQPLRPWEPGGARYRDVVDAMTAAQTGRGGWGQTLLVLVASLIVFVAVGAASWSWQFVLALIPVLLFHETGHYVAMRLFGYANVRMFFIPLFGAAVSGQNFNVPGWKKVLVSLAGPLPGIAVGIAVGVLGLIVGQAWLVKGAMLALILNGFNLLPILPLDGGWIMHTLLFSRHPLLDVGFRAVAALGLAVLGALLGDVVLVVFGVLMLVGVPIAFRIARVTKTLRGRALPAASPGDRGVPLEAATAIVGELGRTLPRGVSPKAMATHALQVLEALNARPPGWMASLALAGAHAAAFLVTMAFLLVLAVGLHRGPS